MKSFYTMLLAEASQGEGDFGWLIQIKEAPLEQIQHSLNDGLDWTDW